MDQQIFDSNILWAELFALSYQSLNLVPSLSVPTVSSILYLQVVSYAPIVSKTKSSHQTLSIADITSKCFDTSNRLVKCDAESGRYISCCVLYRGDVTSKDVNHAISQMKNKKGVNFVDWSPTGFKVGLIVVRLLGVQR